MAYPALVLLTRDTLRLWMGSSFLKGGHLSKIAFLFARKQKEMAITQVTVPATQDLIHYVVIQKYVLAYRMKIFIQLSFKQKAYVLTEKNHSSCSMYNLRNAVQGFLLRAFKFQPKWEGICQRTHNSTTMRHTTTMFVCHLTV